MSRLFFAWPQKSSDKAISPNFEFQEINEIHNPKKNEAHRCGVKNSHSNGLTKVERRLRTTLTGVLGLKLGKENGTKACAEEGPGGDHNGP